MGGSDSLLADATRQVQIADHLLTTTYPLVKDPKLLLSVIEHTRRAIEDACEAIVAFHIQREEYELPKHVMIGGKHDSIAAFADIVKIRHTNIPAEHDAIRLGHDARITLQQHKESPVAFQRDKKLVIAGQGFEFLKEINYEELKKSMSTLKQFVHGVHTYLVDKE